MSKRLILFALLCIVILGVKAQRLSTFKSIIDCGQVEFKKPVTVKFDVTNNGRGNSLITDVRTSCGCMSVDYPHVDIREGSTFNISVVFDAAQMGHFEKQIAIYDDKSKLPLMLNIKGEVVESIIYDSADYPFEVGDVRTDKNDIEFDDVNMGDKPIQKIRILNTTNKSIQPTLMHLPNYLSVDISPSTIAPNHSGVATITLNSVSLRDFGLTQTSIYLGTFLGDKVSDNKEIGVSTVLLPSISDKIIGTSNTPKIRLSSTEMNLGELSTIQNKAASLLRKLHLKNSLVSNYINRKTGDVIIKNLGTAVLEIRRLQIFTNGLSVSLNKTKIVPGETAKLKIKANPNELAKARRRPRVLMITNDPANPKIVITVNVK